MMFEDPQPDETHGLWALDIVELTSVGIDVGTATSQVLFSRLVLQRMGAELSSRFVVVEREVLYLSPVHLTPYTEGRQRIDDQNVHFPTSMQRAASRVSWPPRRAAPA